MGLAGDAAASPAQRRAAGLVAVGAAARTVGRLVAWVVGVAAVAAIVAVVLRPEPSTTEIINVPAAGGNAPTTTVPLGQTIVDAPQDLSGQHPFGGGDARNALIDAEVGEPTGVYWRTPVTGFVDADLVLRGRSVYVGTSQGYSASLDLINDGAVIYESRLPGAIAVAPTIDQVDFGQDDQDAFLAFIADDEGTLLVRPINDTAPVVWEMDFGAAVTGPPLVRTTSLIFATDDGVIRDLYPADGTEQRRFPAEGTEPSGFDGPLTAADGVIYATTGDRQVVVIDEATFTEICRVEARLDRTTTTPVVAEGLWFVGTTGQTVKAFNAGGCTSAAVGTYLVGTDVRFEPVIADGLIWTIADSVLQPIDIENGEAPFVSGAGATITSPPVVTRTAVIVGTASGELVAFDRSNGDELWRFEIGDPTRQRVAVGDDLVLVVGDREIIAVAAPTG